MKPFVLVGIILSAINFMLAQDIDIYDEQASAKFTSFNTDLGSTLVLRNTTVGGFSGRYLGRISFARASSGAGEIGYQTNFVGPEEINFNISGQDVMNLFSSGALTTENLVMSNGATCTAAGVWTDASSKEYKHINHEIKGSNVLSKINSLPIYHWTSKASTAEEHIGPVAEEFYEIFKLGVSDKNLSSLDLGGIGLAGIKALCGLVQNLSNQIQQQSNQIQELNGELSLLRRRILTRMTNITIQNNQIPSSGFDKTQGSEANAVYFY